MCISGQIIIIDLFLNTLNFILLNITLVQNVKTTTFYLMHFYHTQSFKTQWHFLN